MKNDFDKKNVMSDAAQKADLIRKVAKRFNDGDLDSHVIEIKSQEASEINNQGVIGQVEFLHDSCGADWLEELIKE